LNFIHVFSIRKIFEALFGKRSFIMSPVGQPRREATSNELPE